MYNSIILGVPRSGTSLAASLFRHAGYFMGEQLLDATESNPHGYFEDHSINQLNNKLLKHLGVVPKRVPLKTTAKLLSLFGVSLPCLDFRSWAHQSPSYPVTGKLDSGLTTQMKELCDKQPFCYKDPRFTYVLNHWMDLAPVNTRYLVVFRSPQETIVSMLRNASKYQPALPLKLEFCEKIWYRNYQNLFDHYFDRSEFLFVHYNQVLDGTRIEEMSKFFMAELASDLIDSSLARSRRDQMFHDIRVEKKTSDLYRQLCQSVDFEIEAEG